MKNTFISLFIVLALVLCVASIPVAVSASEDAPDGYYLGDANNDGEVNIIDATIVQRTTTLVKVPYPEEILMHADVDSDEVLTTADATFIQRYATLVKTPYPIGEFISGEKPTETPTEVTYDGPVFVIDKSQAKAGDNVTVTVNVKNNPGILGMTLTLTYDSDVLTLINSASGSAVSDVLAFTKPGKYTSPCNFTWDGIELDDDQIRDGELLVLTFKVAENAPDNVYPISISYDQDSIFDKDLNPVDFEVVSGSVATGNAVSEPTAATEPAQPATEAPLTGAAFVVGDSDASAGETVTVAVDIKNNPGILGMTLTLSYDSSVLTLTNSSSGSAVSDVLAFTKPGKYTSPCNFTWDGIEMTEDQIKDGELLILTFDVSKTAARGTYPVTLTYDEDGIISSELLPIEVAVVNGSVTVK